jgi:hypothetical protein
LNKSYILLVSNGLKGPSDLRQFAVKNFKKRLETFVGKAFFFPKTRERHEGKRMDAWQKHEFIVRWTASAALVLCCFHFGQFISSISFNLFKWLEEWARKRTLRLLAYFCCF